MAFSASDIEFCNQLRGGGAFNEKAVFLRRSITFAQLQYLTVHQLYGHRVVFQGYLVDVSGLKKRP